MNLAREAFDLRPTAHVLDHRVRMYQMESIIRKVTHVAGIAFRVGEELVIIALQIIGKIEHSDMCAILLENSWRQNVPVSFSAPDIQNVRPAISRIRSLDQVHHGLDSTRAEPRTKGSRIAVIGKPVKMRRQRGNG